MLDVLEEEPLGDVAGALAPYVAVGVLWTPGIFAVVAPRLPALLAPWDAAAYFGGAGGFAAAEPRRTPIPEFEPAP